MGQWKFKYFQAMPDIIFEEFGKMMLTYRRTMVMPLQTYHNVMATLPKKAGGVRTVAITTTIYRLLMELDDNRLKDFEKKEAFCNDSARAGASALQTAEERALDLELAQLQDRSSCNMLWVFSIFLT